LLYGDKEPESYHDPFTVEEECHQERCWKALLLRPQDDNRHPNEWDVVREHFGKSRSKKVLSIIQSKDGD